ncbi:hypothetical protein [Acinetobacter colistiniresistens]|uniref:hypothetical protein n=1 Tax=Acinetobacter colistiniresistens TaxID=280145 RepID=UPI002FE31844
MSDDYTPPNAHNIVFNIEDDYLAPHSHNVVFSLDRAPDITMQYVNTLGWSSSQVGVSNVRGESRSVFAVGFWLANYGWPTIRNQFEYIKTPGFNANVFGQTTIRNRNRPLYVTGFDAAAFTRPFMYNLRQYMNAKGFVSESCGTEHKLYGGLRYIWPRGLDSPTIEKPVVINTTANQYVSLNGRGIAPLAIPPPNVFPQILHLQGMYTNVFGSTRIQINQIEPPGLMATESGQAWVSRSPREVLIIQGIDQSYLGFPKVIDPTQKIYHTDASPIPGGIFGDIQIRNKSRFLNARGFDESLYGDWATIYSNLQYIRPHGLHSLEISQPDIWNKIPSIIPKSFNTETKIFGLAHVGLFIRHIQVRGISGGARFGAHVLTKTPELLNTGFDAKAFGKATVSNYIRYIEVALGDQFSPSQPRLWHFSRYLKTVGSEYTTLGKPDLSHGVREIIYSGAQHSAIAAPTVWFRVRELAPESIFSYFPSWHKVGGTQNIKATGFDAALFGTRIIPVIQNIYAQGLYATLIEKTNIVDLRIRYIRAIGFHSFGQQASDRYGVAKVWNTRQYVVQQYDPNNGLVEQPFGQWTAIANRNRPMQMVGFSAARFGYSVVENKAHPILPSSIQSMAFAKAMISHRVRKIYPDFMEAPYISGWSIVNNSAFVIAPAGFVDSRYGMAEALNTRRYYRWVGAFDASLIGEPMIADRIRSLGIESRYAIQPPSIPIPDVQLLTRYIDVQGFDYPYLGAAELQIRWNKITTRWSHKDLMGEAYVHNVTPELKQKGAVTEVFGDNAIRTQWRDYFIDGISAAIYGNTTIAYRDRQFAVSGFNTMLLGRPRVIKTGAPPYTTQYIYLDGKEADGDQPAREGQGIAIPQAQVSAPRLRTNVIGAYGFVATEFGSAHLQSNGILVQPGISVSAIGQHTVDLYIRTIQAPSLGDLAQIESTRPRVSPHTIYAVVEAPDQAIRNHPGPIPHLVNSMAVFGHPTFTNRLRYLSVQSSNMLSLGNPRIFLAKNYIQVEGIRAFRFGWHNIYDDQPQLVEQYNSISGMIIPRPKIEHIYRGPQWVTVKNDSSTVVSEFGRTNVEHFHRTIVGRGSNMMLMGNSRGETSLYKPQSLWVGFPKPTIPDGFESERFGNTWISRKVRDVTAIGFESYTSEMEASSFKGRMQVKLASPTKPIKPIKQAETQGIFVGATGVPSIRLKTHYIRPDGNSDQFRKGGTT